MLRRCLLTIGRGIHSFPVVFQLNKRDLPNILSIQDFHQNITWPRCRFVPTIATRGDGIQSVLENFLTLVCEDIVKDLHAETENLTT
jgi:hypothetical protein